MLALYQALRVIEHGFSARREYLLKDGETLLGGPDHYARLSAAKHLREFLLAGRPVSHNGENERRSFTVDEIEAAIRQRELEQNAEETSRSKERCPFRSERTDSTASFNRCIFDHETPKHDAPSVRNRAGAWTSRGLPRVDGR
jgi:hypothetical protein